MARPNGKKQRRGRRSPLVPGWVWALGGILFVGAVGAAGFVYLRVPKRESRPDSTVVLTDGAGNGIVFRGPPPRPAAPPLFYSPAGGPEYGYRVKVVGDVQFASPLLVRGADDRDDAGVAVLVFTPPKGTPLATPGEVFVALQNEMRFDQIAWQPYEPAAFNGATGLAVKGTITSKSGFATRTQEFVYLCAAKGGKVFLVQIYGRSGPPAADIVRTVRDSFEVL